jgi:hypothetical protein
MYNYIDELMSNGKIFPKNRGKNNRNKDLLMVISVLFVGGQKYLFYVIVVHLHLK